jgi:ribosomal protein L37E
VAGMPELGQSRQNTHIMSFLCNATRFNVQRHICDGERPTSRRLAGRRPVLSGASRFQDRIGTFGPFSGLI